MISEKYLYFQNGHSNQIWYINYQDKKARNVSHDQLSLDTSLVVSQGDIVKYIQDQGYTSIIWIKDSGHLQFDTKPIVIPKPKPKDMGRII